MKKFILMLCLLLPTLTASAAPLQSHAAIRQAIVDFLRTQSKTLPGTVDIKVDPIDGRLRLNACPDMEAFLPPGVAVAATPGTIDPVPCSPHSAAPPHRRPHQQTPARTGFTGLIGCSRVRALITFIPA